MKHHKNDSAGLIDITHSPEFAYFRRDYWNTHHQIRSLAWGALDMQTASYFCSADVDVCQSHACAWSCNIEAAAIVFDLEPERVILSIALLIEPETDIFGSGMTGDIAQGLLRNAKDGFLGAGRQSVVVRKVAEFGGDTSAGSVLQGLCLFPQRLHQADIFKRGGTQLLQHRFHFSHRLPRAIAHVFESLARPDAVAGPSFLRRRGAHINAEDLLFDRIVEVTSQPVALLLRRRFT